MSTYEEEHNIQDRANPRADDTTARGRQHATLSNIIDTFLTTSGSDTPSNAYAMEALTSALHHLSDADGSRLAQTLMESLQDSGDIDGKRSKGVSQEYLDTLERVKVSSISEDDAFCPICTNKFKDDKYPLVVRLPCGHGVNHIYDLECVGPWLQMNSTCPLCRTNVLEAEQNRRKKIEEEIRRAKEEDSEEEEEDWDVYG
ncbi:uncharacterized protein SPAPADRAFT_62459 [Spathaspora passalidarum NRRL Y-27907]|uniref:RING-type domain-containing protein n=1 Tax=Spathaspora passalidarum (strain NRRL Y-27907 / 11-Y1) TaxID=619300 RepID=G3ARZ9_SPAPN|nr:uncharacterized protein SPAPADRAFT_62459 [Spathaspora passalidarum NRRL Y-27907]EGW31847.1 hypothetical protein SPAPADRAFT_62459 [Spathaspora passalidarum NRRL Y-27907]